MFLLGCLAGVVLALLAVAAYIAKLSYEMWQSS